MITFRDSIILGYPFLESILCTLPVVDEYFVNDGGSTDGTWEYVKWLAEVYPDKIIPLQMKDYKSVRWDCVTEQYNKMIEMATGDWIFQGDADEVMHEQEVPTFKQAVSRVKNAIVLRHLRHEVFNWWSEIGWYDYWPARTCRNIEGIHQDWKSHGGDEFLDKDREWIRYPPLCKKLCQYKIWHMYTMFPGNNLAKRRNDAEFIATGAEGRVKQYHQHLERWDRIMANIPEWFGKRVVPNLPALVRHHPGKINYEVDERLLDPKYLTKLTGINYVFP
jgi:glycosyltransferase involved in cell wall biosynthesis